MNALRGFTLIEIIIALAIIAVMASFGLNRFRQRRDTVIESFVEQVNRLTRFAYVRAVVTGKLHRVYWDLAGASRVQVEEEQGRDSQGRRTFASVPALFVASSCDIPPSCVLDQLFIRGVNDITATGLKDAWYYVFPSGLAQDIIINMRDAITDSRRGMVLNPFSVRFTVYDEYQQP